MWSCKLGQENGSSTSSAFHQALSGYSTQYFVKHTELKGTTCCSGSLKAQQRLAFFARENPYQKPDRFLNELLKKKDFLL